MGDNRGTTTSLYSALEGQTEMQYKNQGREHDRTHRRIDPGLDLGRDGDKAIGGEGAEGERGEGTERWRADDKSSATARTNQQTGSGRLNALPED